MKYDATDTPTVTTPMNAHILLTDFDMPVAGASFLGISIDVTGHAISGIASHNLYH